MPPTQGSRGAANPGLSKHAPSGQFPSHAGSITDRRSFRPAFFHTRPHSLWFGVIRCHPCDPVCDAMCHTMCDPVSPGVTRGHPMEFAVPRAQTPPPPNAYLEEVLLHSPGFAASRLPWVTSPPTTPEPCRGSLHPRLTLTTGGTAPVSKRPRAPSGRGGTLAPGSVPQPSCLFGWSSRFLNSDETEAQKVELVPDGVLGPVRAPHAAGVVVPAPAANDPRPACPHRIRCRL